MWNEPRWGDPKSMYRILEMGGGRNGLSYKYLTNNLQRAQDSMFCSYNTTLNADELTATEEQT